MEINLKSAIPFGLSTKEEKLRSKKLGGGLDCNWVIRFLDNKERMHQAMWWDDGKLHNDFGPARVVFKKDCSVDYVNYYIDGKLIDRSDFIERYELIFLKEYKGI